jgi:hypothetical protein
LNPYRKYFENSPLNLDERVALILEGIRRSVTRRPDENANVANVRHMETFFSFLAETFPGDRLQTDVQHIPRKWIRTTDRNYIATVPGSSSQQIVLVAHYDTWACFSSAAPGADDNTTGEEVLKHYLLRDLCAEKPPTLTHVYLFSGSEECGTRGLMSQLALIIGLYLVGYAISSANWLYFLLALLFFPFALYRLGITGTRHYVDCMSDKEKSSIVAAIAVDSVGEGRLFIPENEMGANFIRALVPYEGSEQLNDLLEEGAHLNGIKYNRYLAGGTTDSVAFLEERGVPFGKIKGSRIPAAAMITMTPGKASPVIFGGKLHTRHDTPERVYAEPLKEVLTILDYAISVLEKGKRPTHPRDLAEHHCARLFRRGEQLFAALKDAIEPNRRNINSIFKVSGEISNQTAHLKVGEVVWWGVETTLDKEMHDFSPDARRVSVDKMIIEDSDGTVHFKANRGIGRKLKAWTSGIWGGFERLIGRYSFLAMFITAFLVAHTSNQLLDWIVGLHPVILKFVVTHIVWVFAAMMLLQILLLLRLFTRELPAAMDNAYRHRNRADNLLSLRRIHR